MTSGHRERCLCCCWRVVVARRGRARIDGPDGLRGAPPCDDESLLTGLRGLRGGGGGRRGGERMGNQRSRWLIDAA